MSQNKEINTITLNRSKKVHIFIEILDGHVEFYAGGKQLEKAK